LFFGTHPLGWDESGKKVTTAGTKVPVPKKHGTHPLFFGTHPLGWAESGRKVTTAGTKVPIPKKHGTQTLVWAMRLKKLKF